MTTNPSPLFLHKLRRIVHEHLQRISAELSGIAGMELATAYAPTWPRRWSDQDGATFLAPMLDQPCGQCGADHVHDILQAGPEPQRFACDAPVYASPIVVADIVVAIVAVRRAAGDPMLVHCLSLAVSYVAAAAEAALASADLAEARRRSVKCRRVETRLRAHLQRILPVRTMPSPAAVDSQKSLLVARIVDHIHANYEKPLTLGDCARLVRLNATYVSGLFSQLVGVPFKAYLTNLRLEKARSLLGDPALRVSEVACAVGYRDANRFRIAFKAASGLSPARWRAALTEESTSNLNFRKLRDTMATTYIEVQLAESHQ